MSTGTLTAKVMRLDRSLREILNCSLLNMNLHKGDYNYDEDEMFELFDSEESAKVFDQLKHFILPGP